MNITLKQFEKHLNEVLISLKWTDEQRDMFMAYTLTHRAAKEIAVHLFIENRHDELLAEYLKELETGVVVFKKP